MSSQVTTTAFLPTILLLITRAAAECDGVYTPVHATAQQVVANPAAARLHMEEMCQQRFHGFGLLTRGLTEMAEDERELCAGQLVPFMTKSALDMSTGAISAVSWNHTFTCAICEQRPQTTLTLITPQSYVPVCVFPFETGATFRILNTSAAPVTSLATEICARLREKDCVAYSDDPGRQSAPDELYLVVTSRRRLDEVVALGEVMKGRYRLTALHRADHCPQQTTRTTEGDVITWPDTVINSVAVHHLDAYGNFSAARQCSNVTYLASHGRPVWSEVSYWHNESATCLITRNEDRINNVTVRIRNSNSILELADAADALRALDFSYHGDDFTRRFEILDDLGDALERVEVPYGEYILNVASGKSTLIVVDFSKNVDKSVIGFAVFLKEKIQGKRSGLQISKIKPIRENDKVPPKANFTITLKTARSFNITRIDIVSYGNPGDLFPTSRSKRSKGLAFQIALHGNAVKGPEVNFKLDSRFVHKAVWKVNESDFSLDDCLKSMTNRCAHFEYSCQAPDPTNSSKFVGKYVIDKMKFDTDEMELDALRSILAESKDCNIDSSMLDIVAQTSKKALGFFSPCTRGNKSEMKALTTDFATMLSNVQVVNEPKGQFDVKKLSVIVANLSNIGQARSARLCSKSDPEEYADLMIPKDKPCEKEKIDVVFRKKLLKSYSQLAVVVVNDFYILMEKERTSDYNKSRYETALYITLSGGEDKKEVQPPFIMFHVDNTEISAKDPGMKRSMAYWNEDINRWEKEACLRMKSTELHKSVFRCDKFTLSDGKLRAFYKTCKVNKIFSDLLDENVFYKIVYYTALCLSLFGTISIFLTALLIGRWLRDHGHKILLHMTISLSINLALGFANNYMSVDIHSWQCVLVGVLRHYSFLAMFCWLMVLSGLQLLRLLTPLGAMTTPRLVLKVALFAWGLPLVFVASLAGNYRTFYMCDDHDRGYCYPEGSAFTWTVQAPTAAILVMNAFIFLVIIARIYSWFGWGVLEMAQRHGVGTVRDKLRRVGTTIFTFFLFGLSWIFHFLSEERMIKTDFRFEFWFLMSASLHIFFLSLFFVFLDEKTRRCWREFCVATKKQKKISISFSRTSEKWRSKSFSFPSKRCDVSDVTGESTRSYIDDGVDKC